MEGRQEDGAPPASEVAAALRSDAETDREALDKGTRGFVSYLRGYKEHHCKYIFRWGGRGAAWVGGCLSGWLGARRGGCLGGRLDTAGALVQVRLLMWQGVVGGIWCEDECWDPVPR